MTVLYRPRIEAIAVEDIARIADRYDQQCRGLGGTFIGEVDRVIDRLTRFPDAYASMHRSVRKVRVGRFPYFIAYLVFVGEFVVIGVFAEAQHPSRLQQRSDQS